MLPRQDGGKAAGHKAQSGGAGCRGGAAQVPGSYAGAAGRAGGGTKPGPLRAATHRTGAHLTLSCIATCSSASVVPHLIVYSAAHLRFWDVRASCGGDGMQPRCAIPACWNRVVVGFKEGYLVSSHPLSEFGCV